MNNMNDMYDMYEMNDMNDISANIMLKDDCHGFLIIIFIVGIVIGVIGFNLLIPKEFTQDQIALSTEICSNNDGIKRLEWNAISYCKVVCNNGGVFDIQQWKTNDK